MEQEAPPKMVQTSVPHWPAEVMPQGRVSLRRWHLVAEKMVDASCNQRNATQRGQSNTRYGSMRQDRPIR